MQMYNSFIHTHAHTHAHVYLFVSPFQSHRQNKLTFFSRAISPYTFFVWQQAPDISRIRPEAGPDTSQDRSEPLTCEPQSGNRPVLIACQRASQEVSDRRRWQGGRRKVCVRASGRICVSLRGRKQRASRERTKYSTHLCVCVFY